MFSHFRVISLSSYVIYSCPCQYYISTAISSTVEITKQDQPVPVYFEISKSRKISW